MLQIERERGGRYVDCCLHIYFVLPRNHYSVSLSLSVAALDSEHDSFHLPIAPSLDEQLVGLSSNLEC